MTSYDPNCITRDDISNPEYAHAVILWTNDDVAVRSLHSTHGEANSAWRRLGADGRIALREHRVVALDGPPPAGYATHYATMRAFLIAG